MPQMENPFRGIEPTPRGLEALERLRERLAVDVLPDGLDNLALCEPGIHDVVTNIDRQLAGGQLPARTKILVATAVAAAVGSAPGVRLFAEAALRQDRTREEVLDAVAVATTVAAFNGYYRFRDQIPADQAAAHEGFRAGFSGNTLMRARLTPFEVECVCVAVSSVNGCHQCVTSHLKKAHALGMTNEQVDELIRTAAVAAALANTVAALGFG
jgi:alkyl hydroperoxide reductase subunit D